MIVGADE
jgi:chloride channel 3/4/5